MRAARGHYIREISSTTPNSRHEGENNFEKKTAVYQEAQKHPLLVDLDKLEKNGHRRISWLGSDASFC